MKMIYNLVKKDFLLIKKYLLIMMVFVILAPIFISIRTPKLQKNGILLYGVLALMITFMSYHMVSMEEMKQKGSIYLQITPMSNIKMVVSKFIMVTLTFLVTTVIYWLLSMISFTKVGLIGIKSVMICFAIIELFFGIYIPLTFKLGYVKLQMISAGIIFLSPFIISLITKYSSFVNNIISSIQLLNNAVIIAITLIWVMIVIIIGTKVSSRILQMQEY